MSDALPSLLQYFFMAWCLVKHRCENRFLTLKKEQTLRMFEESYENIRF